MELHRGKGGDWEEKGEVRKENGGLVEKRERTCTQARVGWWAADGLNRARIDAGRRRLFLSCHLLYLMLSGLWPGGRWHVW